MKQILYIISFLISFSSFGQKFDKKKGQLNLKVEAIENNINYLIDTIYDNDIIITGFYHFNLEKIIEEKDKQIIKYYFWHNKLISIYNSRINKQFFFNENSKNISNNIYNFYKNKAQKYLKEFQSKVVKPNIKIIPYFKYKKHPNIKYYHPYIYKYNKNEFNKCNCLINNTDKFEVEKIIIEYSGMSYDEAYALKNCEIPKKIKILIEKLPEISIVIYFIDIKKNKRIELPVINVLK